MLSLNEEGRLEIFRLIPEEVYNLGDYFNTIDSETFNDLHKICNRDNDDISDVELAHISKITIGLVLIELDVDDFPEESLHKFVNNFRTSVIMEALQRKGLIKYVDPVSIIGNYNSKLTDSYIELRNYIKTK